ncbi:Cell division cycle 2 1 (PITSLRE proteins) [Fasciola hepatica]|uniref:cyclin-dependent kinase n=1 Tax=Fasciola hepatica TaxID=6192 RepID=A0A4E0RVP9_FASHE|nr:Cell division cycle 2 1 (PITSLRE proteins) [Fasciola hepatica]
MEFLPEVDDELDYNEDDLPSITRRDTTLAGASKAYSHNRVSSKSRVALTSPREEGEEYSEEEEEPYSQPDPKRAARSDKGRSLMEREEGEASSEDERRYLRSSRHARSSHSATTGVVSGDLLFDEAQYRNRLQERYERRESRRNTTGNVEGELNQRVRSTSSQFVAPRSRLDLSPYGTNDQLNPTGPAPSETDRRWHINRSESSEKISSRARLSEDAPGSSDDYPADSRSSRKQIGKPEKKRTDPESRPRSKRGDHDRSPNITNSGQVPRSYSTSYLGYEHPTEEVEGRTEIGQQLSVDSCRADKQSRKSKSKKSKRDRRDHDRERNEYRLHKKSSKLAKPHSYSELDYRTWETSKTDKLPSIEMDKRPVPVTADQDDYSSGSSSGSSANSPSASRSPSQSYPSGHRKHRSRRGNSHSKADPEHSQGKRKHRYHRDARETAPPPDALRTQSLLDSDLRSLSGASRGQKADKHKLEVPKQNDLQIPVKRSRHLIETTHEGTVSEKSDIASGSRPLMSRAGSESADRRVTGTISANLAGGKPTSLDETKPYSRHSRAAVTGYPHALSSNENSESESGERSDSNTRSDNDQMNEVDDSTRESVKQQSRDSASSRHAAQLTLRSTNPYRLYSESESDEADHDDDQEQDTESVMGESTRRLEDPDELNGDDRAGMDRKKSPVPSKPFYFPSIQGCRSVEEFECLNRIEEGTYGVVYRARDKKTNEIVALKRLKMEKERDGFPITSLREINTLMKAQHENIVTVREIVVGSNMDKIYLVMDYVEHDLKSLMEIMNGPFSVGEVKCLLVQLLRAVRHLHDNWILHRDLKTSNLLLSHQGILKVGDFGLAREYGSPLKHYTEVVVTLWYRAPELLLGIKQYTCPIDLWSVGCIFAEFLLQRPLFPGKGEVDELNIIFRDLGTPTERIWPGVSQLPGMKKCVFTDYPYNQLRRRFTEKQISDQGFDLLNSFLTYCPEKRITAEKALTHAYFNERPRAIHPSMFPSWPAKSEGAVTVRKASPRPPAGGGALAAAAAAMAAAAAAAAANGSGGNGRIRYQPPAPPMGGQRFYSSMGAGGGPGSRSGTAIGSGDLLSSGTDKGFLLRF